MWLFALYAYWCGAFILSLCSNVLITKDEYDILPDWIEAIFLNSPELWGSLGAILMMLHIKFDFCSSSYKSRVQADVGELEETNLYPSPSFSKFLLSMVILFSALSLVNFPDNLPALLFSAIFLFFYLIQKYGHALLNFVAHNANPKYRFQQFYYFLTHFFCIAFSGLLFQSIQSLFSGYLIGYSKIGSFKLYFNEHPILFCIIFIVSIMLFHLVLKNSVMQYKSYSQDLNRDC